MSQVTQMAQAMQDAGVPSTPADQNTQMTEEQKTKAVFDRALIAIKTDKKIKDMTEQLNTDKVWLRDNAPVSEKISIPGYGSVQVKAGSAAKPGGEKSTVYTFSIDNFKKLTPSMQLKLQAAGVVTMEEKISAPVPEGTKSVVFTHNQ